MHAIPMARDMDYIYCRIWSTFTRIAERLGFQSLALKTDG